MSSKSALKEVRTALDAKDFELAAEKAKALVKDQPQNYHANVFLGLAHDKMNHFLEAERAYLAATSIKGDDKPAWQGLIGLYEKQGNKKLDQYRETIIKLGQVLGDLDDKHKCQDILDKYVDFVKKNGTRLQYKKALELHLPASPLYNYLEGRLPHPAHTYTRLIEITEAEEREYINREIGERRTRLGARIDQVTLEVKRDAYKRSELEELYRGIVNWSNDDEVRRTYEEKLLQRAHDVLAVLPSNEKDAKREEVLRAARDMVIIKHPFELAWKIVLEWNDIESFSQWDRTFLDDFIEFFPEDDLTKVLKGFLASELSPFPKEPAKPKGKEGAKAEKTERSDSNAGVESPPAEAAVQDRLLLMVEGFEMSSASIVSHRIMGELYLSLDEYESVVDVCRKGLQNLNEVVKRTGISLQNASDSLNIALGNALIHYQSPRHHPEAHKIFHDILQRHPRSTTCLLGIGLILKVDEDYPEAVNFLERALERDSTNLKVRGELSWCRALNGDLSSGLSGLQDVLDDLQNSQQESREFKGEILYRIGYCQWGIDPSHSARKDRTGAYASFLAAIQSNINFAPAYTSLGIYYADYKKDKTRARRCFHKAFELSPSEIVAAERLARTFADQKEWDLVEAVSQRVVDSGKAKPAPGSKRKGYSWPYAALGTVQINKQQYPKSIVSFQAALRISPGDYHSWVGLGESYHNSGRYIAATKAFDHAEELESTLSKVDKEQTWFARYMLANVKRELGEFDDAIERYEEVLKIRPNELGVTIALLQTLTESAWKSLESGLFNDCAELASRAIIVAKALATERVDIFNLWKGVGDACTIFSYVRSKASKLPMKEVRNLLGTQLESSALDILTEVDEVGDSYLTTLEGEKDAATLANECLYASILAYKRAIHVSLQDTHAQAVSWYNLGWAEYRAFRCIKLSGDKKKQVRKFLKAAMRCFKKAIELEAGNSEFWNSLGVVTTSMSPRVAQHAFVRSLHLNDRSAQVWTNLGTLYLIHNDIQLSNEAFTRAQSTDPDYSQAWVGQGFLALLYGESKEARGLFEHAFDISRSSSKLPKQQYTLTLFDHLVADASASNEVSELIQPFFTLYQLTSQDPTDLPFVHLFSLLAERIGEFADAESSLRSLSSHVEAEYEVSESAASLSRFAQANADIARVLLARQEYEEAAEKAETALMLSGEEDSEKFEPELYKNLRLSAHLTAGLAHYYTKGMDNAIDMFRDALSEADNSPDVVCLLAQVLWAKGGEEERAVARQKLFDCLENYPDHVGAVSLLGAIALLDDDKDVIEAVESDLQNMITRDDIGIHDKARLVKLLTAISLCISGDSDVPDETRRIGEAAATVMRAPYDPQGWLELSSASQESHPAEMGVKTALQSVPPRSNLDATDLSTAYSQTGKASDALRAIMVAPWTKGGWQELSHVVSSTQP